MTGKHRGGYGACLHTQSIDNGEDHSQGTAPETCEVIDGGRFFGEYGVMDCRVHENPPFR